MSRYVKKEFIGLLEFLEKYESNKCLLEPIVNTSLNRIHKIALGVLAWKIELERYSSINLMYLDEAVSDIVQTIPLFVQGFYKAAFCLLRSSIENFYKFFLSNIGGQDMSGVKFTDGIYEQIKNLELVKSNEFLIRNFGLIKSTYSSLCLYVHSAESFCAFEEALINFPKYSDKEITDFIKYLDILIRSINNVLCYTLNHIYYRMNHINFELVTSLLSRDTITIIRDLERAPT